MTDAVLATIGLSGYFELASPLNTLMVEGELYTCQAVRKISDYLANNEDIKTDIYTKYSLPDSEYETDLNDDAYIVSLQSDKGHWIYIPARYILKYPSTNGIPYRSVLIGISLPSIPIIKDLSSLETDLTNYITDTLGVSCAIKQIETSRVVLIDSDKHAILTAARNANANGRKTDRARYLSLQQDYQTALNKIAVLEQYIKDHYVP